MRFFRTMKMKATFAVAFLAMLSLLALAVPAVAEVTTTPSTVTMSGGAAITVTYRFTGVTPLATGAPYSGPLTSSNGYFAGFEPPIVAGGPLVASIVNGVGSVTETVFIPQSAFDRARGAGLPQLGYLRSFINAAANSQSSTVTIQISNSSAAGPLSIQRLELSFENKRGEITVKRNRRGLKAFADMKYAGSGLLTGYWEVDGRKLLDVTKNLSFGNSVTLETPDTPDMPTFDTGTHIVRFVPTNPVVGFSLPAALYYVAPGEENVKQVTIPVVAQAAGATLPSGGASHVFTWERPAGIDLFFVEFTEEPGGKPVFSAFTKEARYEVPKVASSFFTPGRRYYWRVKGFGKEESQLGESAPTPFVF